VCGGARSRALWASSDHNLIDCSGIDPRCLAGGAAKKLTIGGHQVVTVGVTVDAPVGYSSNVVAGVMS
jgi:hypothetical protein